MFSESLTWDAHARRHQKSPLGYRRKAAHLVLGLIFVKYISDTFAARRVEADVVEVMVALPGQLFFNTKIPACLWFLVKQKTQRKGEVLFIDARKLATMISRAQSEFTDAAIERIAATVAAWRGEVTADCSENNSCSRSEYHDIPGFCRSVPLTEIAQNGHVLTPGRYVGAEEVEDKDEDVTTKIQQLTEKLGEQMAKGAELDALIRQKLGGLGYEFCHKESAPCTKPLKLPPKRASSSRLSRCSLKKMSTW